jgi:hypothetical protein
MDIHSRPTRLFVAAVVTLFASQAFVSGAMAAKEKFERTKPHVNVGTIGNDETPPNQLTTEQNGSQAIVEMPADCDDRPNKADGSPRPECSTQP